MPKPIFILGIPQQVPQEALEEFGARLERRLNDYHVIILRNLEEEYTAKIYAVEGTKEVDLKSIKNYIKSKI